MCYVNWRAALSGEPSVGAWEVPLFGDARVIGEETGAYGPYQFLIPGTEPEYGVAKQAIVLRFEWHAERERDLEKRRLSSLMSRTDDSLYHGGWLQDEVSSLVSLLLGIRLKPGGVSRYFAPDRDPRGQPTYAHARMDPILLLNPRGPVLPEALGERCIGTRVPGMIGAASCQPDPLKQLRTVPVLSGDDAMALISSARLYQDGLWLAESHPELSWIMLVSAIETAANRWRSTEDPPRERMRASRPDLDKLLVAEGGDALADKVALLIADYMGSTKKFVEFTSEFLPPEPLARPPQRLQHPWQRQAIGTTMRTIYKCRSKALHGGTPFPQPMCAPPMEKPIPEEITDTLATRTHLATWLREDMPMLLHTFEYIARGALLNWWQSMVPSEEQAAPA